MMSTLSQGVGRETLSNIFSSSETYMKLFEFWMPIYKSLQEKAFDRQAYQELFEPASYKEILDKVFDFISPAAIRDSYDQMLKYLEVVTPMAQAFTQQFADLSRSGARMHAGLLSGDFETALQTYENVLDTYKRSISPMLKLPAMGKHREKIELTLALLAKYPAYMAQYAKYQGLMHITGQKTMEKVMEQFAKKIKDPAATPSYDEFFKLWAGANEQAYNELFNAEEFTEHQNRLQNTGLEIKQDFQKLMELTLAGYPVVLRSEMDELYKTVQELRRKIHDLEKAK